MSFRGFKEFTTQDDIYYEQCKNVITGTLRLYKVSI